MISGGLFIIYILISIMRKPDFDLLVGELLMIILRL